MRHRLEAVPAVLEVVPEPAREQEQEQALQAPMLKPATLSSQPPLWAVMDAPTLRCL